MTKAALETALQVKVERYEPSKSGPTHYAQLDVPVEAGWDAFVEYINVIGPRLIALRTSRHIRKVTIDFAVGFPESSVAHSVGIMSGAAEAIGQHGLDIQVSIYLTDDRHPKSANRPTNRTQKNRHGPRSMSPRKRGAAIHD